MRYWEISKKMSSLYIGLDVSNQFKARVPEIGAVFSVHCTVYTVQPTAVEGQGLRVKFRTLAPK
jgi:hypothetical protein